MKMRSLLKPLHIAGTVWLILCAAFLLIVSLHQAGAGWWIIFSVSGFSGIAFLFFISIYLFAVFRGVVRKQLAQEHPLTSSDVYLLFYDSCPLIGTLAGLISAGTMTAAGLQEWFSLAAEGALTMTFLVWIFGDPLLGLAEMLIPSCAAARRERLAAEAENRRLRQEQRQRLLEQIRLSQESEQEQWNQDLLPLAERILTAFQKKSSRNFLYRESIEIGAKAWQKGGAACMEHLLKLVLRLAAEKGMPRPPLAFWWGGIGNWKSPSWKETCTKKHYL
jgi:hypothetical protein